MRQQSIPRHSQRQTSGVTACGGKQRQRGSGPRRPGTLLCRVFCVFCVFCALSWLGSSAWAQPPAQTAAQQAQEQVALAAAWKALRQQNERLEISDAQQAIVSYKSFYEARGYLSAEVAIDLSSRIAQLYWRELGNKAKAREIYDWAVAQYGTLQGGERLMKERALLTGEKALSVGPVQMRPGAAVAPVRAGAATTPGPNGKGPNGKGPNGKGPNGKGPSGAAGTAAPLPGATGLAIAPPVVLGLPKVPMPIDLGGARPVAPVRGGAVALTLSQLEAGAVTPEQAWASGALTVEDVVAALEQRRLFESEEPAKVRLREGLVELLVRYGSERWLPQPTAPTPPPKLASGRVRLAVADYLSHAGDKRAMAVYEELLRETERTKSQGVPVRVVGALNHLASHYVRRGQMQKAVELYLGAEKYSDSPYWHATIRLDVARLYMRMGEEKKAHELYAQVEKYGQGWLTGLAFCDEASLLMVRGNHREARRLLRASVTGPGAEQVRVGMLSMLASSYYSTAEFEMARQYAQEALQQYESLPRPPLDVSFEWLVAGTREYLKWSQQWIKNPITCEPQELRIVVSRAERSQKPITRRLAIRTFRAVSLTVTSEDERIKVEPANNGAAEKKRYFFEKEMIVKIELETLPQSLDTTLTVVSPELPGTQVQIPVHLEAEAVK